MAKCFTVFLKGVKFSSINNAYLSKVLVYFDGICGEEHNKNIESEAELIEFANKNIDRILSD